MPSVNIHIRVQRPLLASRVDWLLGAFGLAALGYSSGQGTTATVRLMSDGGLGLGHMAWGVGVRGAAPAMGLAGLRRPAGGDNF